MALSRQKVELAYSAAFLRAEDLPQYVLDCTHPVEKDLEMPDFASVMRKGWRWVFASMETAQPLTFRELEKLNPHFEYREDFTESNGERYYWGDLLLNLQDRFLPVFAYCRGDSYEERVAVNDTDSFVSSLPPAIARAHYERIAGLGWVKDVPYNYLDYSRIWPHRCELTTKVSGLISSDDRKKRDNVANSLRQFLTQRRDSSENVLAAFYVFLDTRPGGDNSDSGELLLVEERSTEKRLLVVRSMNFDNVQVHENPVEWLDRYTSALLRRLQFS